MRLALIKIAQLATLFIAICLTGCTGMRLIDTQVSSFVPQAVPAGATYRFERLPSQQANPAAQMRLEAMTEQALSKVGLQRNDEKATLTAQVSLTQRAEFTPVDPPGFGWGLGWHIGGGHVLMGNRPLFPGLGDRTSYWREVRLILRDQASQTVTFETRATHDGAWSDSDAVIPAMLDAALQGYPNPPAGTRQVNIEIPR